MATSPIDRRIFLGAAAAVSAGAAIGSSAYGRTGPAGGGTVRVRKEVNSLSATEILEYRTAVKTLRERVSSDPKSWRARAQIHQDFCPHGNWFFLPWHRAYLLYFEEICREAVGAGSTFTLPYWDWTANPLLPAAFWGSMNPLNDPSRDIDPNEPISPEIAGSGVISNILGISDFRTFASGKALSQRPTSPPFGSTGQLEGVPHNNVHGIIGGNMGTYMSPLDPIFWLHHANIDRLWTEWVKLHPADTTTDTDWLDFEVNSFVAAAGNTVKRKVSDLLSTYALGYRYDTQPETAPKLIAGVVPPKAPAGLVASVQPMAFATTVSPLSERLAIGEPLRERITAAARAEARPRTIRLILQDVPVPDNQRLMVRVFLNCKDPSARTPIGDPTYVGSFSFFDHAHAPAAMPKKGHMMKGENAPVANTRTFTFDISEVIRRLERAGQYQADGDLKVSLVPVPLRRGQSISAEIKPAKIEIEGLQ